MYVGIRMRAIGCDLFFVLLPFLSLINGAKGEVGDGTTENPIRDRKESKAQLLFATAQQNVTPQSDTAKKPDINALLINERANADFKEFRDGLPQIVQYRGPGGEIVLDPQKQNAPGVKKVMYYVVEEDFPLTELDLVFYVRQRRLVQKLSELSNSLGPGFSTSFISSAPINGAQPQLSAMTENNRIVRWVPGSTITYSLLKWTFKGNESRYRLVRRNMELAASEWERACNVRFRYHPELDEVDVGSTGPVDASGKSKVTFVALEYSLGGAIAQAFFPNDPETNRLLMVDSDQYYTTDVDRIGVLRHELGHVLGFRHEHIRPDAPVWTSKFCSEESAVDSVPLTYYDRASVMHYPCTSKVNAPIPANFKLEITERDREGAQRIYGPPGGSPTYVGQVKNFDPLP